MQKQLFVVFTYDKGIFTHVLLNALDLDEKGYDVGIILESQACKLVSDFEKDTYEKWVKIKEKKLIAAVCEVCAKVTGALESAKKQGLPINGDMFGHPPLREWIKHGYNVMIV